MVQLKIEQHGFLTPVPDQRLDPLHQQKWRDAVPRPWRRWPRALETRVGATNATSLCLLTPDDLGHRSHRRLVHRQFPDSVRIDGSESALLDYQSRGDIGIDEKHPPVESDADFSFAENRVAHHEMSRSKTFESRGDLGCPFLFGPGGEAAEPERPVRMHAEPITHTEEGA